MASPRTNKVGSSGWGFKPARDNVAIPSDEGKDRYQLLGEDIKPGTYIFFERSQLAAKIWKYGKLGHRLVGPGITADSFNQDFNTAPEPQTEPVAPTTSNTRNNGKARPIVCLNNGKYYAMAMDAERDTGISKAMIGYNCNRVLKTAKGYQFRFATDEERRLKRYVGEIVPVLKPGKRLK